MKRWTWAIAVAVVVAAAVTVVVFLRPDPTGNARGWKVSGPTRSGQAVWDRLSAYEGSYLAAYADRFTEGAADDVEVLAAFNELVCAVTGYGGLWRKTVPNQYFGCENEPDSPVCRKLSAEQKSFARWDGIQEKLMAIESPKAAARFLKKHGKDCLGYIERYVPESSSFSAIQATPFFAENLAAAMKAAP